MFNHSRNSVIPLAIFVTVLIFIFPCATPAQSTPTTQKPSDTQALYEDHFTAWNHFNPVFRQTLTQHNIVGGAFVSNYVLTSPGAISPILYGYANVEKHQGINYSTTYNWASITKTMTAIAIMQLRDRGKLSLDDPAVKYIPELREVHDAYGPIDAVTIRELLNHSAGFRNPTWPWECDQKDHCEWEPFEPTHWSQVAAMLPYTHIDFTPGIALVVFKSWLRIPGANHRAPFRRRLRSLH